MSDSNKNSELHNAAKALGHAGGLRGGPARAKVLSGEERERIAKKAAEVRWQKASRQGKKPSQKAKAKPTKIAKVKKKK